MQGSLAIARVELSVFVLRCPVAVSDCETGNTRTDRSRRNGKGRLRFGLLYATVSATLGSASINTCASCFHGFAAKNFASSRLLLRPWVSRARLGAPVGPTNRSATQSGLPPDVRAATGVAPRDASGTQMPPPMNAAPTPSERGADPKSTPTSANS